MSYKSLLFCPDEKAARLVTQVLSELDFTVEVAAETYAAAKKLAEEHFDALVVDCQNEQDASVLFKAAKNSTENHTSLSVAMVEGQAGVAKAFRIGANLVLTKPINVEQSKGTLRVARGLLKKNQPKPSGSFLPAPGSPRSIASIASSDSAATVPASGAAFAAAASASSPSMSTPAAGVPYAGLELEKDPSPVAEAADVAVLESLPELPKAPAAAPTMSNAHAPISFATHSGGSAAAAAPALEKPATGLHVSGAAPLVTNEPIVQEPDAPPVFEPIAATPSFSSLQHEHSTRGGGRAFLKIAALLLVLAGGGYFGWQKLERMHRNQALDQPTEEAPQTPAKPAAIQSTMTSVPATVPGQSPVANSTSASAEDTTVKVVPEQVAATPAPKAHTADADDIEIQEMPLSRDAKVTVTPKPQPLIVKTGGPKAVAPVSQPIAAPSLEVAANNSNDAITSLVTSNAMLPKPAPGMVRISQGVSQGLLIKKVAPAYPRMALQMRKEGVVDLLATISKEGQITNIKVLNGDAMLANAATEAVRQWQYRPYLLNGQPLEVETQISVSFKLPR